MSRIPYHILRAGSERSIAEAEAFAQERANVTGLSFTVYLGQRGETYVRPSHLRAFRVQPVSHFKPRV